jgi:signal transduction histidine kinase/FixJ family two-component response regulator
VALCGSHERVRRRHGPATLNISRAPQSAGGEIAGLAALRWISVFLFVAAVLQGLAVVYGAVLLRRNRTAARGWLFLLGAMLSMLAWRVVVLTGVQPPPYFNPLIAIWGSTCMVAAMFFFGQESVLRRRAEAERDALLESERAARGQAEHASRIKDEFLATLSHELRTPLAAILGWCAVLRSARTRPEEVNRAIETIERNARAQARLVDDLLDMTRMQAGALHLELAPITLDLPVRAACQQVQPMADAKGVVLDLTCATDAPLVMADVGRLQQVVGNLLVNAVKFTPPAGTVTVTVNSMDASAQLTVADTGVGISEGFLPQLFTRFKQADSSTTRRHGGLGLGLSIAAHLVKLHGGELRAESEGHGKGATFTLRLPLAPSSSTDARTEMARPSAHPPDASQVLHGFRILVVEDDADVRAAVAQLVEQAGAEVFALESGQLIESALIDHRPHVLLVDIGMPGEDGYSLIRRIRTLSPAAGGQTPAISLTAYARKEDRARALAAGFQNHLPKPVEAGQLFAAIHEVASRTEYLDTEERSLQPRTADRACDIR